MPNSTGSIGVAYMSAKTIGLSRINGRKPCTLGAAARHNLREIQAEIGAAGNIDARRISHNIIMEGPLTAAEVESRAELLMSSAVVGRLRKDYVQAIEVIFQAPPSCPHSSAYLKRCTDWIKESMGLPVLSAVIHCDEGSPHTHVLLLPVKAGRYVGGEPLARPMLKQLRDDFFAKVAGPAGFQRHGARLRGEMKRRGVAAVDEWCAVHGIHHACGPIWPLLRQYIERDPTQFVRLLGIDLTPVGSLTAKAIGIAEAVQGEAGNPIGITGEGLARRSLSLCRDCTDSVPLDALQLSQCSDLGELIRVRDEHAHDVEHWAE